MLVTVAWITTINEIIKTAVDLITIYILCIVARVYGKYEISIIAKSTLIDNLKKMILRTKKVIKEYNKNDVILIKVILVAILLNITNKLLQPALTLIEPFMVVQDKGIPTTKSLIDIYNLTNPYSSYLSNVTTTNDWIQNCLAQNDMYVDSNTRLEINKLNSISYIVGLDNKTIYTNIKQIPGEVLKYNFKDVGYELNGVTTGNNLMDVISWSLGLQAGSNNTIGTQDYKQGLNMVNENQPLYESLNAPLYIKYLRSRSMFGAIGTSVGMAAMKTYDIMYVNQYNGVTLLDLKNVLPNWQNDMAIARILYESNTTLVCDYTCQNNLYNTTDQKIQVIYKSYGGVYADSMDSYVSEASIYIYAGGFTVRYKKVKVEIESYDIDNIGESNIVGQFQIYSESTNQFNQWNNSAFMIEYLDGRNDNLTIYVSYTWANNNFSLDYVMLNMTIYTFSSGYLADNALVLLFIVLVTATTLAVIMNRKNLFNMYARDLYTTLISTTVIGDSKCATGDSEPSNINLMTNMASNHVYLSINEKALVLEEDIALREVNKAHFSNYHGLSKEIQNKTEDGTSELMFNKL